MRVSRAAWPGGAVSLCLPVGRAGLPALERGSQAAFSDWGRGASGESHAPAYYGAKSGCVPADATLRKPNAPRSAELDSFGCSRPWKARGRAALRSTVRPNVREESAEHETETLTGHCEQGAGGRWGVLRARCTAVQNRVALGWAQLANIH